ncbi:MAG: IS1595 family transposase [Pirellulales bacterium]
MPRKNPPTGTDKDLNLAELSRLFVNEDLARQFLESKRWPNGAVCPHCGHAEAYTITAKPAKEGKRPARRGLYKCKLCRKQFTVRVGTIFEESKLPLGKWLMAIHLMTSSKKGVSSHQIARELGVTVKTGWFLTMRIREAMKQEPLAGMLTGRVEVDETYVGGKPRYKGKNPRGMGTKKQPVAVLVERNGNAVAMPVAQVTGLTMKGEIHKIVAEDAAIFTDEGTWYQGLGTEFLGGHHTVKHKAKEYVRYDSNGAVFATTNTAESFFALLKRGHYGIFHQLSKRHLPRYTDEFTFRWNWRKVTDGERMAAAIMGTEGKRLKYKQPTNP